MNQPYFIVVLAHSLHGRLRRVHVPYQFVYVVLALALMGSVSLFGIISSYLRMSLKVASYNNLRQEIETLRATIRATGKGISPERRATREPSTSCERSFSSLRN